MIKINLLPSEAGGKRSAAGGKGKTKAKGSGGMTPFILAILALFAGVGYFGWSVYKTQAESTKSVVDSKATLKKLEDDIKKNENQFRDLTRQAQELDRKYAVIQALNPADRVFWSEKLNQLALGINNASVYITRIMMSERVEEVETPESIAKRTAYEEKVKRAGKPISDTPPQVVKMPIIFQTLTLECLAHGNDSSQRLKQITLFQEGLKKLQWERKSGKKVMFTDGFDPGFSTGMHRLVTVGGVEVLSFPITISATPLMPKIAPTIGGPKP